MVFVNVVSESYFKYTISTEELDIEKGTNTLHLCLLFNSILFTSCHLLLLLRKNLLQNLQNHHHLKSHLPSRSRNFGC